MRRKTHVVLAKWHIRSYMQRAAAALYSQINQGNDALSRVVLSHRHAHLLACSSLTFTSLHLPTIFTISFRMSTALALMVR